jgi:hypothetical protein
MALQPALEAEHTMLFITRQEVRPVGYVNLSDSNSWTRWLHSDVPERGHDIERHKYTLTRSLTEQRQMVDC